MFKTENQCTQALNESDDQLFAEKYPLRAKYEKDKYF